jgi:DNA-binding response OmpR family regulator
MMKFLVVEDDQAMAVTLECLFTHYNYAVDIAADGEAGLQMIDAYEYDLILLDLMLPKRDGISLCKSLRARGYQSPILLLTGRGESEQKTLALNAGADDYVVKPFDANELIARVQALLRRGNSTCPAVLTWGYLSVDPNSRKVAYGTHLITVTPKEYAILELLLRNPQKALSAKAILDHIWTSLESPGEEAVRFHIKELRRRLTSAGAPKDLIKTQHQVGYQLNPLYASALLQKATDAVSAPQLAELNSVNEELRASLAQLQSKHAILQQKYQDLLAAYDQLQVWINESKLEQGYPKGNLHQISDEE